MFDTMPVLVLHILKSIACFDKIWSEVVCAIDEKAHVIELIAPV